MLPWGHTVEDFLDGLGVSFDQFCMEMTGGWLFGYVRALQLAGLQVTIFCFSSRSRMVVGIAEIMGDKVPLPGIIAPIADVSALASALERLLNNIGLSQYLGFRAKKRAQDFSLVSVGTQLRSFLVAHANS